MNVAIIGFGRLGKQIDQLLMNTEINVPLKISSKNIEDLNAANLKDIDVALELSGPNAAPKNLYILAENKINTVCGSTGWLDYYSEVVDKFKTAETGFLYASNFSLGMNIAFEINRYAAQLFDPFDFTPRITETHHIHKKDKPSGTAISLAEDIIDNQEDLSKWQLHKDQIKDQTQNKNLNISCERIGEVVGKHEVNYESKYENFSFKHEAIDRKAFALGAIAACKWLNSKNGIFTMRDVLEIKNK